MPLSDHQRKEEMALAILDLISKYALSGIWPNGWLGGLGNWQFSVAQSDCAWQKSGYLLSWEKTKQWRGYIGSSNVYSRGLCLHLKALDRSWHLLIFQTTNILLKQLFDDTNFTRCQHQSRVKGPGDQILHYSCKSLVHPNEYFIRRNLTSAATVSHWISR